MSMPHLGQLPVTELAALAVENHCLKELKRLKEELEVVRSRNKKNRLRRLEEELDDVQAEHFFLREITTVEAEIVALRKTWAK